MEAIEFETTAENGTIQIPEKHKAEFSTRIRVVLMRNEETDPESVPRPRFGIAKEEVWMSDDFDEPLDMFEEYGPD